MSSFRKYKGAHLKPKGGARRRGARQTYGNTSGNNNPITQTFSAPTSPRYYRSDGSTIPIGGPLHRHADGTIMTQHSMGPNDNSVIVSTSPGAFRRRGARTHVAGHNGCGPGMTMSGAGQCVPSGGMRKRTARRRPTAKRSRPVGRRAPRRRR
jgi:hypothetical protein